MDDVPSTLSQPKIAQYMVKTAVGKHNDRYESVFLKAIAAGVMISFGGVLSQIISGGSPALREANPGLVMVLGGLVFPVGLVMIVLQGQELLTSNMLTFPMAIMTRSLPWWSLPLNWAIVLSGNLVGSLFFASVLVHYSGIVSTEPYISYIKAFAVHKAADPEWHQIFLRGIGCNWLVSVAVWQAAGARETISKIFAIWIPIWVFVACGFDHVVANMYSIPLGMMIGADITVGSYARKSLTAAFLGNAVGALFVALPAWYYYLRDSKETTEMRAAEDGTSPSTLRPHDVGLPSTSTSARSSLGLKNENVGPRALVV